MFYLCLEFKICNKWLLQKELIFLGIARFVYELPISFARRVMGSAEIQAVPVHGQALDEPLS